MRYLSVRLCLAVVVLLCINSALCFAAPRRPLRLKVSRNNRFLVTENNQPFFWLGDTAWYLFNRLTAEEATTYLRDRHAKRFTVIQAHLLSETPNDPNAYGHQPFHDADFDRPNEAYWQNVDSIIDRAESFGLYMAIVPAWANTYVEKPAGALHANTTKAYNYARFLGSRYKRKQHIIWILGGDVRPQQHRVYDSMAKGLAEAAAGGDHNQILITYHPPGGTFRPPATSTGEFYHTKEWLDFNMIQSGHRIGNRNYERIAEDYRRTPMKPTLDSEPCYEAHPVEHKFEKGIFNSYHLRQRAYWSLLAGAFGFTYGGNGVWQMDKPGRVVRTTHHNRFWYDALNLEGARQMQHVRALFESRPYITPERVPDQSILASPEGDTTNRVQAARAADNSYWLVYITNGGAIKVLMNKVAGAQAEAWWYNPRDGKVYTAQNQPTKRPFSRLATSGVAEFDPPGGPGEDNDWVLVIDNASKPYPVPGTRR